MAEGKWGESFLKSGLPLEHLTAVTLRARGWRVEPNIEYSRKNRDGEDAWFQIDMSADLDAQNDNTELSVLVECKYHDLSRFWMFLPAEADRWYSDEAVLSCGPLQTLRTPQARTALDLAPLSAWGVVVSQDGLKQDNAIHTAIQQLANGFVPVAASRLEYNLDVGAAPVPMVSVIIPMVVTNAALYRLKPEIRELDAIRNANSPADIADEVPWTWCYHDPPRALYDANWAIINKTLEKGRALFDRFESVTDNFFRFASRPHWIMIVNSKALDGCIAKLTDFFVQLPIRPAKDVLRAARRRKNSRS